MLAIILVISMFASSDTIIVRGTENIYYRAFISDSNLYFQYCANKDWAAPKIIDEKVSEYAMTVTTGDYIHFVWTKQSMVFYKMNMYPVNKDSLKKEGTPRWECSIAISEPGLTEPASNISIETDREYLFVYWQTLSDYNSEVIEKWRRGRWLMTIPYEWNAPECLSEPINQEIK